MSTIDGAWDLVTKTPMGDQISVLTLATHDGVLSGSDDSKTGKFDFDEGTVDGNALAWQFDVKSPFRMRLVFKATVEGDALTGTVKAGALGTAKIAGKRKT